MYKLKDKDGNFITMLVRDIPDKGFKRLCQNKHSIKRAWERYGLAISHNTIKIIVDKIQRSDATFIRKKDEVSSIFVVNINNKNCWVLYDKTTKTISSFLTPEI